ncbi:hypothetical protein COLO4_02912 [Corchorus olitorius]|uniref:Uncharacterized protein n=1 Tax=Corchorus olitorius TaxID=93759 RepID=A0A1R3KZY0_9ROSI|nr:hypothetical protein COLO4_02912 [Corchorus olitorius]
MGLNNKINETTVVSYNKNGKIQNGKGWLEALT